MLVEIGLRPVSRIPAFLPHGHHILRGGQRFRVCLVDLPRNLIWPAEEKFEHHSIESIVVHARVGKIGSKNNLELVPCLALNRPSAFGIGWDAK